MTNAVFMPYVLEHNRGAIAERIARAAAYLGLAANFEAFLDWVLTLRDEIGVPRTLVALGAPIDEANRIVEMALVDPTAGGNPVPLTREGARRIFDAAATGVRLVG
jgi:alcohol dehydrogenase